jgi:hypothetical protein
VCTAWTLARLGPRARSAAPTLAELVARDDAPVARQAALALAEVAPLDETTRAVLESALARRGPELGGALREALARLALNRARLGASEPTDSLLFVLGAEAFVPAAEEVSPRSAGERCLRLRYAALALGLEPLAGAPQREPARLQSMLDDRDPGTRALAAFEIAALGERAEGFVAPLAARCFDGHGGAALSARLALLHVLRCLALERARSRP